MAKSDEQTGRAVQSIQKGMVVKLQYKFKNADLYHEIVGVASSEFVDYYNADSKSLTPYRGPNSEQFKKYCYGASFYVDGIRSDRTHHYYGGYKDLGWCLASNQNDLGGKGKEAIVQMVVDYKNYDTCCLSFYIDGQLKGPKNAKYSMKL
eukprot:15930_1